MGGYKPLYIKAMETGLVQSRENFILPNDAYPTLINAYVWRERIKRKQGCELIGRLQREVTVAGATNSLLTTILITQPNAQLVPGSINITDSTATNYTDPANDGILSPSGSVNYNTGVLTGPTAPNSGTFSYYPSLPVMGIRDRQLNFSTNNQTIFFDQVYAYIYNNGFQEWIVGTTWTGTDYNFFWTTNYWQSPGNVKLFWATNFNQTPGDPIRYTDGTFWEPFFPQIDGAPTPNYLTQCLALLPFRGRLVAFNTWEGPVIPLTPIPSASLNYSNRIRWAAIGNPITVVDTQIFTAIGQVSPDAWRDDITGKGGFLDIPTNEDIISVGFVRDNLVIYCERSTWQLRYTGRSIAPFQIEKVNSELGVKSTFSSIQFDTSLVGIGDKGIVECDSYKSERIDIKIPDLVFQINQDNQGPQRVCGIRSFIPRLTYWMYTEWSIDASGTYTPTYPNTRLVYNYENDSWAQFVDSFTSLGTFQPTNSPRWIDFAPLETGNTWAAYNEPWVINEPENLSVIGGNQQGFIETLDRLSTNDPTLTIQNITGGSTAVLIKSTNHNLVNGQIISISDLLPTDPFFSLNGQVFQVNIQSSSTFTLDHLVLVGDLYEWLSFIFPPISGYLGAGLIAVRDNFSVVSKKFNYLDVGQSYQLGYIDILMNSTTSGAISLRIYENYQDDDPTNIPSQNSTNDTFFNSEVPTFPDPNYGVLQTGSKIFQRVICPSQSNFITIEWTLSDLQMTTIAQSSDVQIDSQILWSRPGGRLQFLS